MVSSDWNMYDIFNSEKELYDKIKKYTRKMNVFFEKYINIITYEFEDLLSGLKDYEEITEFLYRVRLFMSIRYYDVNTKISKETEQIVDILSDCYKTRMEFFPIHISEHIEIKDMLNDKILSNYRKYIANILSEKKYFLDSRSEKILKLKEATGYQALQQIYLDVFENANFNFRGYGTVSYNQLLVLLNCGNYKIRKLASKKLGAFLSNNNELFTSLFNYTTQDLYLDMQLRGYQCIYEGIFRENEFNDSDIKTLIKNIKANSDIFQYHYRLRAKNEAIDYIEGINFTSDFQNRVGFEDALKIIMRAIGKISPQYSIMVSNMVNAKHIDFECKEGKQSGSICFASSPKTMPYIFINYSGTVSDLFTLAHEIGHAIHFMSLARCNSFINFIPANMHTEVIAVFFETLVGIEYLIEKNYNHDAVLEVSDNIVGKLFRQAINAMFEMYTRDKKGYADKNEIEDIWVKLRNDFYGDTVKFYYYEKNNYWSIPHFICDPLMTAIYSFSQLISLNLILLKDTEDFAVKFNEFMCNGANESFREYMYDIFQISVDNTMWNNVFSYLKDLIKRADKVEDVDS